MKRFCKISESVLRNPESIISRGCHTCQLFLVRMRVTSDQRFEFLRLATDNPINQQFRNHGLHLFALPTRQHGNLLTYHSVIINCGEQVAGFLWLSRSRSILGRAFKVRKSRENSRGTLNQFPPEK